VLEFLVRALNELKLMVLERTFSFDAFQLDIAVAL
jgi:hypothetical protein